MSSAHSLIFPSLYLRHSPFSNPSVVLCTSQLILQPFRCFTYVSAHSPILISLLLRHRLFTYVTWRAAHAPWRVSKLASHRWGPEFASRSLHVGFVVDETEPEYGFLRVCPVFPCQKFHSTIYPQSFHYFVSFHFISSCER